MIFCIIDVCYNRVDCGIGIFHQARPISGHRIKTIDRFPCLKQVDNLLHSGNSFTADVCFTQEEIRKYAHHRNGKNNPNPGDTGGGLPMRPQQHPDNERDLDENIYPGRQNRRDCPLNHGLTSYKNLSLKTSR